MVDLGPLASLAEWAIAATVAFIGLLVASAVVDVQLWWMVPATVCVWGVLKVTLFKDTP